jgi:hypothetical protein
MIIAQQVWIKYLIIMISISRTVYPDGRVSEYKNGVKFKLNQAPDTIKYNNWINFIYNYAIR